ncbi:hypothetical protein KIPB_003440, partial [Kipferlia bialata]|eukprot:g3440.t1
MLGELIPRLNTLDCRTTYESEPEEEEEEAAAETQGEAEGDATMSGDAEGEGEGDVPSECASGDVAMEREGESESEEYDDDVSLSLSTLSQMRLSAGLAYAVAMGYSGAGVCLCALVGLMPPERILITPVIAAISNFISGSLSQTTTTKAKKGTAPEEEEEEAPVRRRSTGKAERAALDTEYHRTLGHVTLSLSFVALGMREGERTEGMATLCELVVGGAAMALASLTDHKTPKMSRESMVDAVVQLGLATLADEYYHQHHNNAMTLLGTVLSLHGGAYLTDILMEKAEKENRSCDGRKDTEGTRKGVHFDELLTIAAHGMVKATRKKDERMALSVTVGSLIDTLRGRGDPIPNKAVKLLRLLSRQRSKEVRAATADVIGFLLNQHCESLSEGEAEKERERNDIKALFDTAVSMTSETDITVSSTALIALSLATDYMVQQGLLMKDIPGLGHALSAKAVALRRAGVRLVCALATSILTRTHTLSEAVGKSMGVLRDGHWETVAQRQVAEDEIGVAIQDLEEMVLKYQDPEMVSICEVLSHRVQDEKVAVRRTAIQGLSSATELALSFSVPEAHAGYDNTLGSGYETPYAVGLVDAFLQSIVPVAANVAEHEAQRGQDDIAALESAHTVLYRLIVSTDCEQDGFDRGALAMVLQVIAGSALPPDMLGRALVCHDKDRADRLVHVLTGALLMTYGETGAGADGWQLDGVTHQQQDGLWYLLSSVCGSVPHGSISHRSGLKAVPLLWQILADRGQTMGGKAREFYIFLMSLDTRKVKACVAREHKDIMATIASVTTRQLRAYATPFGAIYNALFTLLRHHQPDIGTEVVTGGESSKSKKKTSKASESEEDATLRRQGAEPHSVDIARCEGDTLTLALALFDGALGYLTEAYLMEEGEKERDMANTLSQ